MRQSISFTEPNGAWLKTKVEIEGEYKSNSELINELIRRERSRERHELLQVRAALAEGEASGISLMSPDEIMDKVLREKSI